MIVLRQGKAKNILENSINSALTAVETYNRPRVQFRIENYIILMIIAWTKLFHAYFQSEIGERYFYKEKNGRYKKIDGERKAWELTECIKEYQKMRKPYPNLTDPVVANLRFFIGIRNKIEHRYWDSSSLDILLFGECQALLFNYESFLVTLFGEDYSINTCLAYALQFSHLRAKEQLQAQRDLLSKDMLDIKKYPLILIDEYQDSYKPIIDRFISFFIAEKKGPQFGFFGDAWQTIYQSNKACGLIENENLEIIKKGSNFRSAPRIVRLLNDLRPDLPQTSAIDGFDGEVIVITCDDYTGPRRTERNLKGELPAEELKNRLNNVTEKIKRESSKEDDLKVLMITHKVLATQQGYEQLLEILDDGLRDKEDPFLLFFMDTVEPIYQALKDSNMQLLFDTLGIKRFPIKKKSEKVKWKELQQQLEIARTKRAIDVFELIKRTKLIPIPPKLDGWYHLYQKAPETVYVSNTSIQSFLELDYLQFIAAIDFLFPDAMFSTEHGVKGEEYDNVVFVISKGWNLYQFETYAPMITGHVNVPEGKQASYERNRNLFYVCCSRPKKRLFFFVSVPIDAVFRAFLTELVGTDNIYTYSQYLKTDLQ